MTTVAMDCQVCGYTANHSETARQQWDYLDQHYKYFHDRRKNPMAPTIVQQVWHKLDEVMETALTWEGNGKFTKEKAMENNAWYTSEDELNWLGDKINYTQKTSIGRGLAEALVIMCYPSFETSDQVVALAVKRYQAKASGEEMPATPGFMGAGATGDDLRIAGGQKPVTQTPSPTPTQNGPKASPKPVKSKLNEEQKTAIKKALAAGFDISQLAGMYGVKVEEIKELK